MRIPLYDPNARRKTISMTINADLAAKASALGINLSRTAEDAIAAAFTALERERIKAEIAEAVRFTDAYVAEHGRPWDDWTTENLTEDQDDDAA
jgi:antitoxin CcdA